MVDVGGCESDLGERAHRGFAPELYGVLDVACVLLGEVVIAPEPFERLAHVTLADARMFEHREQAFVVVAQDFAEQPARELTRVGLRDRVGRHGRRE